MINSLIVVGGGTSGLVSALMLKKSWPNLEITVIESSNLGIIGVGEGSTEHWQRFMDHMEIYTPDLFREAGATYKVGIKFNNWHGDNTSYWHSIVEHFSTNTPESGLPYMFLRMVSDNFDPNDTAWKISTQSRHVEPLHSSTSQYHFDTFKLNDFLHKIAKSHSIKFIDTDIVDVELDEQGYVSSLIDKDNQRHSSDFYIDCSGFRRVIGSKLGIQWVDCQQELPMNRAMAFPTPGTFDIPSYTQATAMSSGWMWRIPTQERYGNGYVFCDSFINEEQAEQEVKTVFEDATIARHVKFTPGYVNQFWVKNCAMIGLSSVFVEPLEASSIGTTIQQTFLLIPALFSYSKDDGDKTSQRYNDVVHDIANNVIDFIQLHYFTQRNDSEFWKWCKSNIKITDFNRETLEYFKNNWVYQHYFNKPLLMFTQINWIQVMHGLRMFNTTRIQKLFDTHLSNYRPITDYELNFDNERNKTVQTFTHREAIELLKERYKEVTYKL
jgi:hypothetical protein